MATSNDLHISSATRLSVQGGGLVLQHDGDIVLDGSIGRFARVESRTGNVTLRGAHEINQVVAAGSVHADGEMRLGVIEAGGDVELRGSIDSDQLDVPHGDVVTWGDHHVRRLHCGGRVQAEGRLKGTLLRGRVVQARTAVFEVMAVEGFETVDLGACQYKVEVVVAPTVLLDGGAAGRINVIESHNELAPTSLKGRFRLAEYTEFTGVDPGPFLAERGVRPLSELAPPRYEVTVEETTPLPGPPAPAVEVETEWHHDLGAAPEPQVPAPPRAEAAELEAVEDTGELVFEDTGELEMVGLTGELPSEDDLDDLEMGGITGELPDFEEFAAMDMGGSGAAAFVVPQADDEDSIEELEDADLEELADDDPLVSAPQDDFDPALASRVSDTITQLAGLYRGERPDPVVRLEALVQAGRFTEIGEQLEPIFNDLVRSHAASGTRAHHQVFSSFEDLQALTLRG